MDYEIYFIKKLLRHTRLVQGNMIFLENNIYKLDFIKVDDFDLFKRSLYHDIDKLEDNLVQNYVLINKPNYKKTNSKTHNEYIGLLKSNIVLHYKTQRHHFYRNDTEPNIIDICEMCCDITSVATLFKEKDNTKYFKNYLLKENPKLANYSDMIFKIFKVLSKKNNFHRTKKSSFINKIVKYIRKLQSNRLLLMKNIDFKTESFNKIEFFRDGLKNDIIKIEKLLNPNELKKYDYNKIYNEIIEIEIKNNIYEICCELCAKAFMEKNNNYFQYCIENLKKTDLKYNLNHIEKICKIIINRKTN